MPKKKSGPAPLLGIFWLVDEKLIFDTTSLSEAERFGDNLNHPRGHIHVWEEFERTGRVPRGSEYEEYPRGRVIFDTKNKKFMILGDKCILKDKGLIAQIKEDLHLPTKAKHDPDSHYRCPLCLRRKQTSDDEDWDV